MSSGSSDMKVKKRPALRSKKILVLSLLFAGVIVCMVAGKFLYDALGSTNETTVSPANKEVRTETKKKPVNPAASERPEKPARLVIDKIGVDAAIEQVGLTADGNLDAPNNNEGVGWYEKSALLGESRFSLLLDGHFGARENPAVFYRLSELRIGDTLTVEGVHGAQAHYAVVETENIKLEEVDMKKAFYPYRPGVQSMTIITCDGDYDPQRNTYDNRLIVYATRKTE